MRKFPGDTSQESVTVVRVTRLEVEFIDLCQSPFLILSEGKTALGGEAKQVVGHRRILASAFYTKGLQNFLDAQVQEKQARGITGRCRDDLTCRRQIVRGTILPVFDLRGEFVRWKFCHLIAPVWRVD